MLNKWKTKAGLQILEKMVRSDQAGEHLNALPLSLVAMSLKASLNFLIMYRLATGYTIPDVALSMVVTCFTAFLSPAFYTFARQYEPELLRFTRHVRERVLAPQGLDYALTWRNRGVLAASAGTIVMLKTVDVDSNYLVRCIVEWLLSFWIADQINQYRDALYVPQTVEWYQEFLPPVNKRYIEYVKVPLRKVKYVTPPRRLIEEYVKPQRATLVQPRARKPRQVFEDWTCI